MRGRDVVTVFAALFVVARSGYRIDRAPRHLFFIFIRGDYSDSQ